MKNNKKTIYIIIITLLIISIAILLLSMIFDKEEVEIKVDNEIEKTILKLIEDDYITAKFMTGNIKVSDSQIKIDDITYYYVDEAKPKKLELLEEMLNKTYTTNWYADNIDFFHKENHIIEYDNALYTNIKKECDIGNFLGKNFKILSSNEKEIVINYYGSKISIYNQDNKWKLNYNIYRCPQILEIK